MLTTDADELVMFALHPQCLQTDVQLFHPQSSYVFFFLPLYTVFASLTRAGLYFFSPEKNSVGCV